MDYYTGSSKAQYPLHWVSDILNRNPLVSIGVFTFLYACKNWIAFYVSKKQFHFIYGVAFRISAEKMSAFLDGHYLNYVKTDSSVHIRSINYDPIDFSHYVLRGVQQVIGQCLLIFFAIVPILFFKPLLFSLLSLILFPPVLLIAILSKKKYRANHSKAAFIHKKLIQHSKEAISGFIESNIFQKKNFFFNRYNNYLKQQSEELAHQQITQTLPSRLIEVFAIAGLFILISINFFTGGKSIDLITIGAFMAAAYKVIPGIVKILNSLHQIKTYSFTITNLLSNLQTAPIQKQSEHSKIDSIEFCDISFNYNGKEILRNINLHLEKGGLTGITGVSGKGKTTLLNLLLGFLNPGKGNILVNDSIKNAEELQSLWHNISYVQQRAFFLNDTIIRNITLQETGHDTARLMQAIQISGLHELIIKSAEGLDKVIAEDGKNISGGQRQRIALARALYKDADLIILDEPFNELDRKSENCILNHLKELAQSGKMIILITHDKESLSFCNKVINLDES